MNQLVTKWLMTKGNQTSQQDSCKYLQDYLKKNSMCIIGLEKYEALIGKGWSHFEKLQKASKIKHFHLDPYKDLVVSAKAY